jgi:hypothetical protein
MIELEGGHEGLMNLYVCTGCACDDGRWWERAEALSWYPASGRVQIAGAIVTRRGVVAACYTLDATILAP